MYEVVFAAGSYTTTVEVPILDDSTAEAEEIFYGSLATVGDVNVEITQERAEIRIIDDDGVFIQSVVAVDNNFIMLH